MVRGKPHKSAAESPQLATLSASIIILHGPGPSTFCMPHQCPKVGRCWSRDGCLIIKKKKKIPTLSSRVVNLPLFLLSHSFTAIFIFLSVFAFVHAQHASAMIEEGATESHAPEPCILQRRGNSPASFSIPTSWHFSLSSINQTPRPAELKKRNKAFEENRKKRGFCTESVQDLEGFLLTDVIRVWGGHLLWCTLTGARGKLLISGNSLSSGLEKCQPFSSGPLSPLHDQQSH